MIPFPLMGGATKAVVPPIPTGVEQYTGTSYRGPDGDVWLWSANDPIWRKNPDFPDDPGHPAKIYIGASKIGTDGSFRRLVNGEWSDIPGNLLTTDAGVNIGPLIVKHFDRPGYSVNSDGWKDGIFATEVPGRPDLFDLYILGSRTDFGSTSNKNNVYLIMTGVKRDRIWQTAFNWVAEKDNGELWFQGTNYQSQYGPTIDSRRVNPWTKIADAPAGPSVKDVYVGAEMVIYATNDGKFFSRGLNIGQFDDLSTSVWSALTEIPASRFPGFKRFYQSVATGGASSPAPQLANCVWYLTDTGLFHFGSDYAIATGERFSGATGVETPPYRRVHTRPHGIPQRGDAPTTLWLPQGTGGYFGYKYDQVAIWYDDPHEVLTMSNNGLSRDSADGSTYRRSFFGSSSPAYKTRPLILDFTKEATVIQGYDGKTYASGTPTQLNGLTTKTVTSSFVDQKMNPELFLQYGGAEWLNGNALVLLKDGKRVLTADPTNGSDFFGNGTKWRQTVTVAWASYPDAVNTNFWTIGKRFIGRVPNRNWLSDVADYTVVGGGAQGSQKVGAFAGAAAYGHTYMQLDGSSWKLGGNNYEGLFGTSFNWTDPRSISGIGSFGSATVSYGTWLSYAYDGSFWILGKNYWEAGQPVYSFPSTGGAAVRWDQRPGFVTPPNFAKFIPALIGYSDDEGTVAQPYFMYRGTDGKFYASGSNSTGCLGTGSDPTSRDQTRWTFEPIKGSEVFGNKFVKVYYGHGSSSALLFLCDGKMYGLGSPGVKWNDSGTVPAPFFPGFNKRLNEITFLMDMPDVMWTRPLEK